MGLSKDIPSLETGTPNAAEVISIPTRKTSTEISVDDFLCGGWKTFQAVHGGCCQGLSWACLYMEPANKEIAKTPPQHISCVRINQEVTKERNTFFYTLYIGIIGVQFVSFQTPRHFCHGTNLQPLALLCRAVVHSEFHACCTKTHSSNPWSLKGSRSGRVLGQQTTIMHFSIQRYKVGLPCRNSTK